MKFRQRLSWLLVVLYIGATMVLVHYLFEISEGFNTHALEHIQRHHPAAADKDNTKSTGRWLPWLHMVDIPLSFWLVFLLPVYMQVFGMLLACTRPEPKRSLAFLWPGLVYLKCYSCTIMHNIEKPEVINSNSIQNGQVVIHT